jgi:hypothetical protein
MLVAQPEGLKPLSRPQRLTDRTGLILSPHTLPGSPQGLSQGLLSQIGLAGGFKGCFGALSGFPALLLQSSDSLVLLANQSGQCRFSRQCRVSIRSGIVPLHKQDKERDRDPKPQGTKQNGFPVAPDKPKGVHQE